MDATSCVALGRRTVAPIATRAWRAFAMLALALLAWTWSGVAQAQATACNIVATSATDQIGQVNTDLTFGFQVTGAGSSPPSKRGSRRANFRLDR